MELDFLNNSPIYLQIVEQIKIKIFVGEYKCGDKIPSVREYAMIFKVNPNTMQKALTELENLNLIYTERTNGKFVTKDQSIIEKQKNQYAEEICKKFVFDMKEIGFCDDDIAILLKNKCGGK